MCELRRTVSCLSTCLAIGLVGCGGQSLCEHIDSALRSTNDKGRPCGLTLTGFQNFTKARCDQNIKSCTDADQKVLSDGANCLDGVPTCSTGQQQAWANQVNACVATQITVACAAAVFQ
jgi:hypothetical protein